jgi:hypothetical protein
VCVCVCVCVSFLCKINEILNIYDIKVILKEKPTRNNQS